MYDLRARRAWETEEVALFRAVARRFVAEHLTPHDARFREQRSVDRSLWLAAGERGLNCPSIAEEYGGGGGTYALEAVLAEELAYAGVSSWVQSVHGTIVAHYIAGYGSEAQKKRWLPELSSGRMVGAIAMTEPSTGSDLQALRTSARKDGDHYVINGAKTFITNGVQADLVVLAAKTGDQGGSKGISLIVVEVKDLPGYRCGRSLHKIGMHGSDTAELFFEDVRVPVENLLGAKEGQGFVQLMQQLPQERLALAVAGQAAIERAVELTASYTAERHAFGKPLNQLQNTRFQLAECLTIARVSRSFIDDCIAQHVEGKLSAVDASMAKYWCTEQQGKVLDACVQLHGGYGYMEEYAIARMFVDARVQRIYGGANEIMKELIARSIT